MTKAAFEREDFDEMCLFTGAPVKKTRKGEHVIPRWLIDDYELTSRKIEMGRPGSLAQIRQFRSRADPVANGAFGDLENRVKLGQATPDELHLWQKKISAGMVLNHWRLAQNERHPLAPANFDARHMVFVLEDFRADFKKFADNQPVPRAGSTLVLPTSVPGGWLAHVFGSTVKDLDKGHDAILSFGMVAITHRHNLIISVLYDPDREFESSRFATEWKSNKLGDCSNVSKITAALAVAYSEFMFTANAEAFGTKDENYDGLLKGVAYQLGLDVDPCTMQYRFRTD